jgi:hypothetical protein
MKEEKDLEKYISADYFYKKAAGNNLTGHDKKDMFKALNRFTSNTLRTNKYISQSDHAKSVLAELKHVLKSKISTIYADLNRCQSSIVHDRTKIDKRESELDREQKDAKESLDNNIGVNRLIKQSIVETYNTVKNSKRATSIKMQASSASKYLKKTKNI